MKKFLTYSVVAATLAWSLGISSVLPAAAATAPADGSVIKLASGNAVYYVSGGKKLNFTNRGTYSSWSNAIGDASNNFTGLKVVSQADFDMLGFGGNVTVRTGAVLVQFNDSAATYAVGTGAKLYQLADAAAKTALFPSATIVRLDGSARAAYYNNGNSVATLTASSLYPDGTFVKATGSSDIFMIEGGMKRALSADAATANFVKASWVQTGALTGYTTGTAVAGKEGFSAISGSTSGSVVTGSVTVSLASNSPAAGSIVAGQAIADLAHFSFSGTGTVTGLKIKRIGVSADETLTNIYLYDGNTKLTDAGSVSNGVISFNNPAGLFNVSGSKIISVKSDIKVGTSGESVGVAINAATDVTGVTVGGTFPINGNLMGINSATLAAGVLQTAQTVNNVTAGTSNVTLWYNTINITGRSVNMKYVAYKMVGSAPVDAFSNIRLFVNGVQTATGSITTDGILSFDLGAGVTLNTGSQSIEVRGDVVKGSSRTFKLSLQSASDIMLVDSNYGAGITVTGTLPSESASATISNGTVSIVADPSFTATQVVSNATNATLGKWIIKAYGEDMKFLSVKASTTKTGTAGTTEKINNLAVYINGAQVGSSQTLTLGSDNMKTYGSGNLFTVAAGTSATIEIKGDLSLDSATTITALTGSLQIVSGQVQGVSSLDTTTYTGGVYTANALTIASGAVTLAKNAAINDQTIAPNTTGVKIGSFVISNSDADTIRVTNINVLLSSSTLGYATNTSDLYISENTNKVSPQTSNNFAVDFTLAPSQTKTVDVYITVGNVTGTDLGNTLISSMNVTARTSANATAYAGGPVKGQSITVQVGTLSAVTKTTDSMSAQYVIGGSSNLNLMMLNFKTNNAPIIIDELGFQFRVSAPGVGYIPVTSLTVNGVTKSISDANAVTAAATTTLTGLNLTIPAGYSGKDVAVAANYNTVGFGAMPSNFTVSSTLTYIKYRGGATTYTSWNNAYGATSSDFLLVATKPTVSVTTASNSLTSGTNRIARINVAADAKGAIILKALPIIIATSTVSVSSTANSLVVKTAAGDTLTTTNTNCDLGTCTITFASGYKINAGSTAMLDLYVQSATGISGTSGASQISTKLGAQASFLWDDVEGNATNISGTYYSSWPIDSVSIKN